MAVKSRRKAREAALRSLYEIELGQSPVDAAAGAAVEEFDLAGDQRRFALNVVSGFLEHQSEIDNGLAKLIHDFDFDRVAPIDRNILRIAAYEFLFEPSIPPKVTINEAIEIAKKYSTAESGRFVNGVLGRYLSMTPKANWDPSSAPIEEAEERYSEPEEAEEEEIVTEDSEEVATIKKFGSWTIRNS